MYMRPVLVIFTAMSLILGVAYPVAVTGVANIFFPKQAEGSLVYENNKIIGSALLAQPFQQNYDFWGRMPNDSKAPYNSMASGGANLSASSPLLVQESKRRLRLLTHNQTEKMPIPNELITHSASGLDPQISLNAARFQVARVAKARGIDEKVVLKMVEEKTENNITTGFVPLVNVLILNQSLDNLNLK